VRSQGNKGVGSLHGGPASAVTFPAETGGDGGEERSPHAAPSGRTKGTSIVARLMPFAGRVLEADPRGSHFGEAHVLSVERGDLRPIDKLVPVVPTVHAPDG